MDGGIEFWLSGIRELKIVFVFELRGEGIGDVEGRIWSIGFRICGSFVFDFKF